MQSRLVIQNVRPMGKSTTSFVIENGLISESADHVEVTESDRVIDGNNMLLLPGFVEGHIHLDTTLWGLPWRSNTAGPELLDYINNQRRVRDTIEVPIFNRAENLLKQCIGMGTTHMRSHIDIDPAVGMSSVEELLRLREKYSKTIDLQFVTFPQFGLMINPGTAGLMEEAIKAGVDIVGGIDPAGIDNDPIGQLETVFNMASHYGCGIDIHLHDLGSLGAWQVERIIEFTKTLGLAGKVMISHAYCLGTIDRRSLEKVAKGLADNRISIMTTAVSESSIPPFEILRRSGINVCCGSDGIRDTWTPLGNGDMLERATLLAYRYELDKDEELDATLNAITFAGAKALNIDNYGLRTGFTADFVILDAETTGEAIAIRPPRAFVIKSGKIVAQNGNIVE
ncbi:MAG: amidohydrolase family protein [Desulfobacterales bacterium]|nr:amidohydrolase family protein [Desulfobacterales bacterium]